jgi:hypothetical protein
VKLPIVRTGPSATGRRFRTLASATASSPNRATLEQWFRRHAEFPEAVLPDYAGGSIGNVAPSIVRALLPGKPGAVDGMLPPLANTLLDPEILDGARVVALLVLDGYGLRSQGERRTRFARGFASSFAASHLTSVFPSTTSAALTTIQTGTAPGQHGLAGYTLFIRDISRVINMIQFKPVDGGELPGGSIEPRSFLATPTMYDILSAHGIECEVVSHREYARSALTIMQSGDTPYSGHRTLGEMVKLVRDAVAKPGRRFVFGYWAGVDMLAHTWGPRSSACRLEAELIEQALIDGLLDPLADAGDDVCVIVTADHGLMEVPEQEALALASVAAPDHLRRSPTGERRAVGLVADDDSARQALARGVGTRGVVLDAQAAINAGLFGPRDAHPDLLSRLGDTLLLARGQASFPFRAASEERAHSLGAHGSLSPEEMLVPLYAWRFGRGGLRD